MLDLVQQWDVFILDEDYSASKYMMKLEKLNFALEFSSPIKVA